MSYVLTDSEYAAFKEVLAWRKGFSITGALKSKDGVYALPPAPSPPRNSPPQVSDFDATIKSWTLASDNQWTYVVRRAKKTGAGHSWGDLDSVDLDALNDCESINAATGTQGNGVVLPDPDGATLAIQPIPVGSPVTCRTKVNLDGTVEYWFSKMNGVAVTCPA